MNGTQISDTQRNNRTALTGHTIEALIVVVFYACRFIRGERSLGYFLVITALALIPVILGQFFFLKDRETGMIKHTVGIGFAITHLVEPQPRSSGLLGHSLESPLHFRRQY